MDILPFAPVQAPKRRRRRSDPDFDLDLDAQDQDQDEKTRRELLDVAGQSDDDDWCLFTVDVRNSYGLPFEVHFERNQPGMKPATTSRLVTPGSTSRYLYQILL